MSIFKPFISPFYLSDADIDRMLSSVFTPLAPAPVFTPAPAPKPRPEPKPEPHVAVRMPILRLQMMLHFASSIRPFAPEHTRTSAAYTRHVKTLLRQGMIERPKKRERREHPGWSYRLTDRGRAYVQALRHVGLPELVETETVWHIPS